MPNNNLKHGFRHHPLYFTYQRMKNRCYKQTDPDYRNYGGRGITVCDEWINSVSAFAVWAITHNWKPGLTLDRENVNGNYCPTNCRFVTAKVSANNTRSNRRIEAFGETKTLAEWSEDKRCVVNYPALYYRVIIAGWSPAQALTKLSRQT